MQLCELIDLSAVDENPKCQYNKPILFPEDRWYCDIYGNARLGE